MNDNRKIRNCVRERSIFKSSRSKRLSFDATDLSQQPKWQTSSMECQFNEKRISSYFCHAEGKEETYLTANSNVIYKNLSFERYDFEEKGKPKRNVVEVETVEGPPLKVPQQNGNKLANFIAILATEHETLLEIILFLPLILMACYIAFIEKEPLYRIIDQ